MGWRFRKRIRLLPGLRVNLSKSGASVSIGGHGLTENIGPHGVRSTASLPGTGISYSTLQHPHPHAERSPAVAQPRAPRPWLRRLTIAVWIVALLTVALVVAVSFLPAPAPQQPPASTAAAK